MPLPSKNLLQEERYDQTGLERERILWMGEEKKGKTKGSRTTEDRMLIFYSILKYKEKRKAR